MEKFNYSSFEKKIDPTDYLYNNKEKLISEIESGEVKTIDLSGEKYFVGVKDVGINSIHTKKSLMTDIRIHALKEKTQPSIRNSKTFYKGSVSIKSVYTISYKNKILILAK